MNCWEILGLSPDSDRREIKRRFAQLVKLHRPDDDPKAYQRIREAYEQALLDNEKEATQDQPADDNRSSDPNLYSHNEEPYNKEPVNARPLPEFEAQPHYDRHTRYQVPFNHTSGYDSLRGQPFALLPHVVNSNTEQYERHNQDVTDILNQLLDEHKRDPEYGDIQLSKALDDIGEYHLQRRAQFEFMLVEALNKEVYPKLTLALYHLVDSANISLSKIQWAPLLELIDFYLHTKHDLESMFQRKDKERSEVILLSLCRECYSLIKDDWEKVQWFDFLVLEMYSQYGLASENINGLAIILGWVELPEGFTSLYVACNKKELTYRLANLRKLHRQSSKAISSILFQQLERNHYVKELIEELSDYTAMDLKIQAIVNNEIACISAEFQFIDSKSRAFLKEKRDTDLRELTSAERSSLKEIAARLHAIHCKYLLNQPASFFTPTPEEPEPNYHGCLFILALLGTIAFNLFK